MIERLGKWYLVKKFEVRQEILKNIHFRFQEPIASLMALWGSAQIKMGKYNSGLGLVLKSRRIASTKKTNKIASYLILREVKEANQFHQLLPTSDSSEIEKILSRILILKMPKTDNKGVSEKGAVVIKFSETFSVFFNLIDVKNFSKYFNIVLEPSWVGYALPEILIWSCLSPTKVFIMAPYKDDFEFLSNLKLNLIPLTLGPSDWVNPDIFYKIPNNKKIYDAIYVANYNPVKRVERYILAVANARKTNPNFKGALVCAGHGSAKTEINEILKNYSADADIAFFGSMNQAELNLKFNQSKVNVLISLKEGSNKGLAEGLFSGTPGLLISENAGGNHAHINEFTGRIVPDAELEQALNWFSDHSEEYNPDVWVRRNMSPVISTQKLSALLEDVEINEGREWTNNLLVKTNTPELTYVDPKNNWLLKERRDLLHIFSKDNVSDDIDNYFKIIRP